MKITKSCWRRVLSAGAVAAVALLLSLGFAIKAEAKQRQELQVFAASSLTEALTEVKQVFEKSHPDAEVKTSFGGSSVLRFQVEQGATPEVFESADEANIKALWQKGYIAGKYRPLAYNSLTVIVPAANRANINSPQDLARPGVVLVGCAPEVPIGTYTLEVLDKLEKSGKFGKGFKERAQANFRSLEPNVKGIVAKVALGDADAGICYVSDVSPEVAKQVKVIPIPEKYNVRSSLYVGLVKGCRNPDLGRRFIDFSLSPAGQAIFSRHGLTPVSKPVRTHK